MKRLRKRARDEELTSERALAVLSSDVRTQISAVDVTDPSVSIAATVLHTHVQSRPNMEGHMDRLMVTVSILKDGAAVQTVLLRGSAAEVWARNLALVARED